MFIFKKLSIIILIIFIFSIYSFIVIDRIISEGKENYWQNVWQTNNLESFIYQNRIAYRLKENVYQKDKNTDLIIHFDEEDRIDFNIIGNYNVKDVSYIPDKENKKYGKASANFSLQNHKIVLVPDKKSLFSPSKDLSSFTIDFWFYPESIYENNVILSYYGPCYIKEYNKIDYAGLKIYISQNKIIFEIDYIFYIGKEPIVLTFDSNIYLEIAQWQHIAISYNSYNGKLVFLKNGIKEKIYWLTDNGNEYGTLLNGQISEYIKNDFIIGSNIFGNLDEFHISNNFCEEFSLSKFVQEPGELISKVIDYKYYTSKFKKFNIDAAAENNSKIYIFARTSEELFAPDEFRIPWVLVNNNSVLIGKYIQWKLVFYSSYSGSYTPYLYDFVYSFEPNLPPAKPKNISYQLLGEGKVKIMWDKNIEPDIKGYLVYYGKSSRYYVSNDAKEGPSPIFTEENYIILTLPIYVDYYISVRALDNAYVYQKSEFSDEIVVRTQ
jgi:hypothetical protein